MDRETELKQISLLLFEQLKSEPHSSKSALLLKLVEDDPLETQEFEGVIRFVEKMLNTSSKPHEKQSLFDLTPRFSGTTPIEYGGSGNIHQATDIQTHRKVALKYFTGDTNGDLIHNECEIHQRLAHDGIISFIDYGTHESQLCLVTEFADGGTLHEKLHSRPTLSSEEALFILKSLVESVSYLHSIRFLHLDLKPKNIVNCDGLWKIIDFGCAVKLPDDDDDNSKTLDGYRGTRGYGSPEQLENGSLKVGPSADIFAMGCIARNLFQNAFQDHTLPEELKAICDKCCEDVPENRYQTANQLLEDLKRYEQGRPLSIPVGNRIQNLSRHARYWGSLPWTRASYGLILVGLFAFLWNRNYGPAVINLNVLPTDAQVQIDDEMHVAIDGNLQVDLYAGDYEINVSADGYHPVAKKVSLRGGENRVSYELKANTGFLKFDSAPSNAFVEVRDSKQDIITTGYTPFQSDQIPFGDYDVLVKKEFYQQGDFSIIVPDGGQTNDSLKTVRLEPINAGTESLDQLESLLALLTQEVMIPQKSLAVTDAIGSLVDQVNVPIRPTTELKDLSTSGELKGSLSAVLSSLLKPHLLTWTVKWDELTGQPNLVIIPKSEEYDDEHLLRIHYPVGSILGEDAQKKTTQNSCGGCEDEFPSSHLNVTNRSFPRVK